MIVMTISNWRGKLKLLVIFILVALIAGSLISLLHFPATSDTADNDRDADGSLKVEATSESKRQEVDSGWLGEIVETLKHYYQD